MKIENGKIVEATESELHYYWLSRELFELYPFQYYKQLCQDAGTKIIDEEVRDAD